MKNTFTMLVGLPASGKSHYAKILQDKGYIVHSSDKIRKELYNNVNEIKKNNEVFELLHKRVIRDLQNGDNVCYDATNLSYKRRKAFLQTISKINCTKECVVFATPFCVCIENDNQRSKKVGLKVLNKMYKSFMIPIKEEGWDNIRLKYYKKEEQMSIKEWYKLYKHEPHDNPHHEFNIGMHMEKSAWGCIMDNVISIGNYDVIIALLMHDVGKIFCKEYNKDKHFHTYYCHQNVSTYDSMFYALEYTQDIDKVLHICKLINWHMEPFNVKYKNQENKLINKIGKEDYNNILILHYYDKKYS